MTTPQPIRIGVMGTYSTGKTTLLKRIEMELRAHGIPVARTGRLGKRAALAGLPKMQHHTATSTEWIITQGIADEIAATRPNPEPIQVVLADRAPSMPWPTSTPPSNGDTKPPTPGSAYEIPHQRVTSDPDSQAHAVELAFQLCLKQATP